MFHLPADVINEVWQGFGLCGVWGKAVSVVEGLSECSGHGRAFERRTAYVFVIFIHVFFYGF